MSIRKILRGKIAKVISLVLLVLGAYLAYQSFRNDTGESRYVVAMVERGILVVSVSGSGQVSVLNRVDIKPKVSEEVLKVMVKNGQPVRAGALLAELDAGEARKAVRDAEVNLESARLGLQKLKEPPDAADITQAENALAKARIDLEKLRFDQRSQEQDLAKKKEAAATDITKKETDRSAATLAAFGDFPVVVAGLEEILFSRALSGTDENHVAYASLLTDIDARAPAYGENAVTLYRTARERYERAALSYRQESTGAKSFSEVLAVETEATAGVVSAAVAATNNFLDFVQDALVREKRTVPTLMTTHQSSLDTYTAKSSTQLSNLRNANRAVADARQALTDAEQTLALAQEKNPRDRTLQEQTIKDKEAAFEKLRRGPSSLDTAAQELAIRQREIVLSDAREKLADYLIRAPFEGVVTALTLTRGDSVSPAAPVATLITAQKLSEVSLNEVDAVKVKVGQRATLTFDALPEFGASGRVAEIDALGTVAQGVVTYVVKIAFDTENEEVKPGMSVSAAVVTETKPNVLLVPNSAIKEQGGRSYVEIAGGLVGNAATAAEMRSSVVDSAPRRQRVQIGAANDEFTEIVGGLQEGDRIVVRTIQPGQSPAASGQQAPFFRFPGGGGGGFRR